MGSSALTFDMSTAKPLDAAPPSTAPAAALQGAVAYGVQQDPVKHARLLRLQEQLGIPPVVSTDNEKQVQQQADVGKLDPHYLTQIAPATSAWASSPDNAAVSGVDEIHRLAGIEQNAAAMRLSGQDQVSAYTPSFWENTKDKLAQAFTAVVGKTPDQMKQGIYQFPLTRGGIDVVGGVSGMAGNIGSRFGWHGDGQAKQNLLQRIETNLSPEENTDPLATFHQSNEFDWLAKNVAPMIPAMLASGGTSLLAETLGWSKTAAKVAAGLTVGGMFTADQSGKTYTAVAGSGGSAYDALLAANRVALINAAPNALFGATDVVPWLRDNPFLTSLGIGGLTGASGQYAQNVVTGRPGTEGVLSSAVQGAAMQGGMHIGMEALAGGHPQGNAFLGNLSQAVDAASESQLRERSPEKFHEALQNIFDGHDSLRIPAEQFNDYFAGQKMDPQAVAGSIGAGNYAEAALSGGDVEIPKANFLGQLDPEHQKGLLPHVVDPATELTATQQQQGVEELQQWVSGGGADKLVAETAAADAETAASPEFQVVKGDLQQRYVDAGEVPEVAEALATKDAHVYSNLAKSVGMKPSELLSLYGPKVVAGSAPGDVLYQDARNTFNEELAQKIATDPEKAWGEYRDLPSTDNGRILNTDDARELSEHYRADRTRSADVHEAASQFIKDAYARKLAEPVGEGREPLVLFTAGGTGAGKSVSLRGEGGETIEPKADIVYDTNMNTFASADGKIQQALDSGRDVAVRYTYREPVEAFTGGMLPRAMRMGRTVPMNEHVRTHVGARAVIDQLQAKYADNPHVEITAIDNSHGKDNARGVPLDAIPQIEEHGLRERLQNALNAEHAAGRISDAVRAAVDGPSTEKVQSSGVGRTVNSRSGGETKPQRDGGSVDGRSTTLLTPTGKLPARYALVEASSLIPSHDPFTFSVNPRYPEGVQERAYDKSKEAQARVIDQAQNYEPAYTVNTNPDAVNGPPVVTADGTVLGGNSRAMSTMRLYRDGNGDVYRDALKRQATSLGLTPEAVDKMKEPVLVRRVDIAGGKDELRRLGTDLNRSMTGALGAAEKAVSAGKNITPETLRTVSGMLQDGDHTLRELMAAQGSKLVQMMVHDGVITDRERPQYVDPATGGLNEAGKSFVEKALLGSVIDDPRLMEDAPKSVLNKLERSLGAITSFSSRADEWNILPALREATGELGAIQRAGSSVDLWTSQSSMFGGERNLLVDAMTRALDRSPNEVRTAFETFSRDVDANLPGQSRMFGAADAFDAFNHAFGSSLSKEEYENGLEHVAASESTGQSANSAGQPADASASAGDGDVPSAPAGRAIAGREEPTQPDDQPRGWFRVLPDGSYEIGKTEIGDLSTFVHEPAHAYLRMIGELAGRDEASETLKGDYAKILEYLGAKDGETLTREQQETWARANEQYLREGKAPSPGLKGAFQRFAVWLGSVYKKASDLGVTLTDDIRGVFDRMYAAEDGVNKAEAEAGPHLFTTPEEAGWTAEQFAKYAADNNMTAEQAKSDLLRRLNEAAVRDKSDAWREEEANVRSAVTTQIDQRPEYAAIRALRKGQMEDGTPLTMSREELVKQFGEERVKELQKQHPGLYRNEGGLEPETAAEMLGFDSAQRMLESLEAVPRRSAAIDQATREYMTAKHGDIRYDGSLQDQARIALENDKRADALYSELKALKEKLATAQSKAEGQRNAMRGISIAPIDAYRDAAQQMVESKAVADLQPTRYLDASRKYSREAFDALRKGDAQAAADAKHKELMNHFLFREATKAKEYIGKFESYAKRMQTKAPQAKLGLAGEDFRDQFNHILGRYGLGPGGARPERSLAEWSAAQYEIGKEPAIDPAVMDETRTVNYRNAPVSEIRAVHDALINVRKLASLELGMEVNGRKVEFSAAMASMEARARESLKSQPTRVLEGNATTSEKGRDLVQRGEAVLARTEFLMKRLDGGAEGPWHDNLWNLAADAQGSEYKLQAEVTKRIGDALENMPKEQRLKMMDKVTVEGIPETVTRHDLVSMAFNMGNEGNLERLGKTFVAHGWDPAAIGRIQGMLTREEWQFVQDGWESLKPLGQAQSELERRLTGLPPVMVKPTPLHLDLADGPMDLDGGYYPVVMDSRFSGRGAQQDAGTTAQNLMEAGYGRAATSRGNMKERTGFGGPLQLDYEQVLTQHTAKVIKDISHREFMLTANKLLMDPQIRQTIRETLGPGFEEKMMPWLRSIVNDRNGSAVQGLGDLSRLMGKLRTNMVKASLGFKASTMLLQLTHASSIFLHTSPLAYGQAMIDFLAHPSEMTEEIRNLSPNEMHDRGENIDRDMRQILQNGIGKASFGKTLARAGMFPVKMMDHVLSFPLWLSVYRGALNEHATLSEADAHYMAMHKADGAVRTGLGSNAPKDLPPVMRNNDFWKIVTTLGGFHNLKWNQIADVSHDFARNRSVGQLTYRMAMAAIVPAVVGAFVTGHGPKDDENSAAWAAKRALLFAPETVPLLGEGVQAMENHGDVKFSPLMNIAEKAAKAGYRASSGGEDKDWTGIGLDAGEAAGEALGVPGAGQAAKTLRYLHKAGEGRIADPNAWEAVVGAAVH